MNKHFQVSAEEQYQLLVECARCFDKWVTIRKLGLLGEDARNGYMFRKLNEAIQEAREGRLLNCFVTLQKLAHDYPDTDSGRVAASLVNTIKAIGMDIGGRINELN